MGYEGMNTVITNLAGRRGRALRRPRHQAADQGQRRRVRQRSAGDRQVTPSERRRRTPAVARRRADAPPVRRRRSSALRGACASASAPCRRLRGVDFSIAAAAFVASSARTAPANRRSPRSSPACTRRTRARSSSRAGRSAPPASTRRSTQRIVTVHQDINLIPTMTVVGESAAQQRADLPPRNHPQARCARDGATAARAIRDRRRPRQHRSRTCRTTSARWCRSSRRSPRSESPDARRADLVADRRRGQCGAAAHPADLPPQASGSC